MSGECGLIIDFYVVCAKIMSFVHVVFSFLSYCDINMVLIILQEDRRSGTMHFS